MFDGDALRAELHALVNGGHEPGTPVAYTVHNGALAVLDDDKARQVFILGAEAVADPSPQRRPAPKDGACVHRAYAPRVIDSAGGTGTDDGEVVGMLRHVFKPVGNPQAALAALLPLALALEQRRTGLPHRSDGRLETVR